MVATTTTSAARVAANRLNAQRSTGPRTAEGKARSRANALKHGLTGAGVALPTEDQSRVEARFVQFQEDLAPADMLGMVLVQEMALMSVRLDRAARHEAATLAQAGARASVAAELAELAEVDHLFDAIVADPGPNRRRLLTTPAGVDRLIAALTGVRDQLEGGQARHWGEDERADIEAFFGRKRVFFPIARTSALLEAINGDFRWFPVDDPAHQLSPVARLAWARKELVRIVDAEIAQLATIHAGFDRAALDRDRSQAADRALFDPGLDATAARRYEAQASRRFQRALRDFRINEAGRVAQPEPNEPNRPARDLAAADRALIEAQPAALTQFALNEPNRVAHLLEGREPTEPERQATPARLRPVAVASTVPHAANRPDPGRPANRATGKMAPGDEIGADRPTGVMAFAVGRGGP